MKKFFLNLVVLLFAVPIIASAVVPTISISSNKGTNVCSGDTVVYSSNITFGGASPSYQWMVNGNPAGSNASTFTATTLSNGDAITCMLTSNDPAASPTTATSNSIVMNVTTSVTPVIAIQLNPNDTICAGTSVTFTATIGNGGSTPAYQWRRNGAVVGSNSSTYTTSTLSDGDTVVCVLTSNETCVTSTTATSNAFVMTVNPILTPVIAIGANPGNNICAGQSVTFTANIANGGTSPVYEWKRNGVTVGTNANTYTSSALANGDNISCELTSNEMCVTSSTATSNNISMTVTPNVTPAVSIAASQTTVCAGDNVTFTATPTNGGTPSYQWKVNGANTGPNNSVFMTTGLTNGAVVTCVMTSSITCVTSSTATSNAVNMTVNPIITPDVTIAPSPNDTICSGQMTTFTATPVNGGTSPTYQWQINSVNAGSNSSVNTFSRNTFNNGDIVRVIMTGNGVCATKPADTSVGVRMEVIPNVEPVVVITRFPNDTVCDGTNIVFSSNSANAGMSPSYQWQVNGGAVGSSINSYNSATLANGDVVRLIMTSSIVCVTKQADTSNDLIIGVKLKKTPDVTIVVAPNDTICAGDNVTFTATATNTGLPPSYQWQVNGANVGANSTTYMTSGLTDGAAVRCIITTADTCVTSNKDTSAAIIMNVKPILTPDVTIAVSPNDTVCVGDIVTFTATPTNGGTTPSYQWRINGSNVGSNSTTYATTTLVDGEVVDCILTSSEMCVSQAKDTSAGITMTVKPKLTPNIQIVVLPNDTVCDGTNVTFIATPSNEGMTPTYQWQINNVNAGTNASSFSSTTLSNGDVVRCILTSSELCVTQRMDTSNSVSMTVNPNLTPVVTIAESPNDTICTGTNVTFTATPTNGGTTPTYQWRVNGTDVGGAVNSTYSTTTLANNDVVDVILTSSEVCVTKAKDTSNGITMTVKPYLTPNITTAVAPNDTVCDGTNVMFTATATDTGTTPTYQWQVNGTNVGSSILTYSSSTLANNDVVRCIVTSSEMCVTQVKDTSNEITMTVNPNLTPDVSVVVSPDDTICIGTLTSFIATPTNGGTGPSYQWKINGSNVGINNSGFSSGSLSNSDTVTCVMTSNETCLTRTMDTSDAIIMTVNPLTTPGLTITANTGTTSCINGEVTFNTTATGIGTSQTYQWRLNGADVAGANSASYLTTTLATGDVITCRMDITAACPAPDSAISNALNMTIVTPSFDITATPNDTICDNEIATYRVVNAVNVGTFPLYQWNLGGIDQVGAVGDSLTPLSVQNQDVIVNSFTGSDNCINAPATAANNTITMTVNTTAAPTITITANPGNVLTNSDIVFFTSSTNTPTATYQWRKNGVDIVGATGILYTDTDPVDGDSISLLISTTDSCRIPDSVLSNVIVLSVGVSVSDVEKDLFDNVIIAPNPNSGTFMLKGHLATYRTDEHVLVEIVNAVGAVVYREDLAITNNELNAKVELADRLSSGLHLVRISAEGKTHVLKFIAN